MGISIPVRVASWGVECLNVIVRCCTCNNNIISPIGGSFPSLTVCELDLVFSLHKSLLILFEMFIGGMLCESNKREVLKSIVEAEELVEEMTKPGEDTASQLDDGLSFQEQFQLGRKPGRRTGGGGGRM